jgi:hypothetical protein
MCVVEATAHTPQWLAGEALVTPTSACSVNTVMCVCERVSVVYWYSIQ